jgi:4a-hydroxytetrahydrobiopterin dehydratase
MARPERTYSEPELAAQVMRLPGWSVVDGWLTRKFVTDGWPTTLMLVNAIGYVAEAADHHPDLHVAWPSVTVKLRTHSANGITQKDLELAAQIDVVALWRPPTGSPTGLTGVSRPFVRGENAR